LRAPFSFRMTDVNWRFRHIISALCFELDDERVPDNAKTWLPVEGKGGQCFRRTSFQSKYQQKSSCSSKYIFVLLFL